MSSTVPSSQVALQALFWSEVQSTLAAETPAIEAHTMSRTMDDILDKVCDYPASLQPDLITKPTP